MRARGFVPCERFGYLALLILAAHASAAADDLLYYLENGTVVFTNTPSRGDVRPVPGIGRRGPRSALLQSLDTPYDPFIERVARENGLDPSLIKVVALVESGFNPMAVSPKGAKGIMQLMPGTARRYGVRNVHDPYENLRAGAEHLRDLLDEFGGDLTLALAAYNAGAGAVRRYGGVPAYAETQDYVQKIQNRLGRDSLKARRVPPSRSSAVNLRLNPDGSIVLSN
jgi:soluble lytic murein transglycosylase-like protein